MKLPEPKWLSLSETRKLVIGKTGAEPDAVEVRLVNAFQEEEIEARGRRRRRRGRNSVVWLGGGTWDQADVNWEESSFVVPSDIYMDPPKVFIDVEASRQSILSWLSSVECEEAPLDSAATEETTAAGNDAGSDPGQKKGEPAPDASGGPPAKAMHTKAETEQAYLAHVEEKKKDPNHPRHPTIADDREWGFANSVTRKRWRELRSKYNPEKDGRRPKITRPKNLAE